MNEVMKAIKSRRSVRAYRNEPLKKEDLDAIVEAGIYAPSANNAQPWHFTVLLGRETIGELNRRCMELFAASNEDWMKSIAARPGSDVTYNAPVLVIISARLDAGTAETDCAAAMENMMLAAESLGVGSCWMGLVGFLFQDREAMKRFGVPEGYAPREAAVFGYVDGEMPKAPPRNMDVVTWLGTF